eukprot:6266055-Amphidinium_carterae.1
MGIQFTEMSRYPDSLAKMLSIYEACDQIGVDVAPAAVCEGVTIVPLQSWYNSEFDEEDPFPDPNGKMDRMCKWPIDADSQLWRYMAKLNERAMSLTYGGKVITMSHFLPRRGLGFTAEPDRPSKGLAKTVGNEIIDEQLRLVGSRLHVFGHGRQACDTLCTGVRYISAPLLYEKERGDITPSLTLVYNGKALCAQSWGADGIPPEGVVKRLLHIEYAAMRTSKPQDFQRCSAVCDRLCMQDGIEAVLCNVGSKKMTLPEVTKEVWPELEELRMHGTSALLLIADNTKCLKECLHSSTYAEWQRELRKVTPLGPGMHLIAPLGQDFQPESKLPNGAVKDDPCVAVFFLRLQPSLEDSPEYEKILKALKAINALPNSTGRISASFQAAGSGVLSMQELLAELDWQEDRSYHFTHEFVVQVNSPESLKLLLKSKTFEKWRASYAPHIVPGSGEVAFLVPLSLQKQAAAPREDKSVKFVSRGKSAMDIHVVTVSPFVVW